MVPLLNKQCVLHTFTNYAHVRPKEPRAKICRLSSSIHYFIIYSYILCCVTQLKCEEGTQGETNLSEYVN